MPEAWKKWEGRVVNEEFPLLRYLGGSDRSAVFLTQRTDHEPQELAIKLIQGDAKNPELQLSWWELAAKLSHPHLLRLFQLGRCQLDDAELLYVVTECAEESLAQILPYRSLTTAETQDMLRSVLDALAYIHAKGFVHGHIKPANILAVGDQIKISSDGLCGTGESIRVLSQPGVYAAPEISNGGGMSPASDVWSAGITLVEALTQRPPAWAGTAQSELVLPDTLPQPFFDIASHCLRRDPQRRWTIAEVAGRLQQAPPAHQEKEILPSQNRRGNLGYVVAALAAVLLLAIFGTKLLHHRTSEPAPPTSVGSSAGQAGPTQDTQLKEKAASGSNASHPASKNGATNSAPASNSAGGPQGAVAQQILPDVSRSALRTIHGHFKVRVKVSVDSSGNVSAANFDSRGPSNYFAERTLQAARRWTFQPPQLGGRSVPSQWMLKFQFERSGINVQPTQISP